ncbi:hypothetical protein AF335_28445 [Streptomyces eurocidicus]|uniref:Uncharacterized protein n=1 Tax=Streptomyces eurocidicus TaxID=66423 RepID=A0A2N8NPL5_STREU|nr:hypothetical protein [Streptomyces eurocidicus]MBB5119546.1 hypothetical protein [Streptomyces eurocidicus]MBF6050583.1 hypothetical protein [Streptomyces eurocidicus]PNE30712.1 hypothetical protein AF335_28445 [Streptomyces eurocidicus]
MLTSRSKDRHRDLFPATAPMTAALPLAISLPAVSVMFGNRFGTTATVVLTVLGLALIACTAGPAARSAERARRDEAVLDALEPLAGLRR